jgi:pyruvate dehydrogenase E2 component (dihydrolipoamide acetyltransferase)
VDPVSEVRLPDIGEFTEVPVAEVLVAPGDVVEVEQPLLTLESDKATMDVPSPAAGVVVEVLARVGDLVSRGSRILLIRSGAEEAPPEEASSEPAPPSVDEVAEEPERRVLAADFPAAPAPETAPSTATRASPAVHRMARELGVDLHLVEGSGLGGRVRKSDVQAFIGQALNDGSAAAPLPEPLPAPEVDFAAFGPVERRPLSRLKQVSGARLHRSWTTIPHVTSHEDADITDLEAFRKEINREQAGELRVTLLAFVVKAAVLTLRAFPDFNASLDGGELCLKRYYHVGFAADTPRGLVVPVLRDADRMGVLEIAGELARLAARARAGELAPSEMQGGSFTVSSLGGVGGTAFTPIVNAPEVAILGVSRAAVRPVWDGAAFQPRLILPLSLSWDHRVVDGAAAARFNLHLAGILGDVRRALL